MRFCFMPTLLALALSGCAHHPSATPTPRGPFSPLEYDLYAVVIHHQETPIFAPDSTTPVVCRPGEAFDDCTPTMGTPDPEAWAAFIANNRVAVAIDPAALRRRGIEVIGPYTAKARKICPPIAALVRLSRAGFNHDSTVAVIKSSFAAGPGPFAECGYAGGAIEVYAREPGGPWEYRGPIKIWMS